ncbi:hypothetical protein GUITHDRAFT_107434 [Guillardia theta CCMP2712]|uniref:Uncharacterized protein n=1 Tax=Guillardia theta (strain CCMP2712) TaxID=905079 RepID=L1JET2_GUITC|nr:hypothetical protein GUITHDRAFT_107434 [Guillardia theta CCMP2712]EKX46649.1 hypothetical protein GUITHDRAFT_107434 [Guillardia theta CCMP2712]|eukprot:XP_005833629.1 hypothetical protein GUITHDRAFT_107434 [Guillardia theta CCMP2712]
MGMKEGMEGRERVEILAALILASASSLGFLSNELFIIQHSSKYRAKNAFCVRNPSLCRYGNKIATAVMADVTSRRARRDCKGRQRKSQTLDARNEVTRLWLHPDLFKWYGAGAIWLSNASIRDCLGCAITGRLEDADVLIYNLMSEYGNDNRTVLHVMMEMMRMLIDTGIDTTMQLSIMRYRSSRNNSLVATCVDLTVHDNFLFKFMKYISVDSYGSCYKNAEERNFDFPEALNEVAKKDRGISKMLVSSQYRFSLAIENTVNFYA